MSTLFIGNNTIRLPIVDSTNSFALKLAQNSYPPEGTIVIADNQTQGRGQRDNSWVSEDGKNITLSLILYPKMLTAMNQFLITQIISLAIVEFIETETNIASKIKWPNDIYVENKKIAGILIENSLRGQDISLSIIGIGLNINQINFNNQNACSLASISGRQFDLSLCLISLCKSIEARYLQLINKNWSTINSFYQKKLFRINQIAKYELAGKVVEGKIIGVNAQGKLLLALQENFTILELNLKEVKFIL